MRHRLHERWTTTAALVAVLAGWLGAAAPLRASCGDYLHIPVTKGGLHESVTLVKDGVGMRELAGTPATHEPKQGTCTGPHCRPAVPMSSTPLAPPASNGSEGHWAAILVNPLWSQPPRNRWTEDSFLDIRSPWQPSLERPPRV